MSSPQPITSLLHSSPFRKKVQESTEKFSVFPPSTLSQRKIFFHVSRREILSFCKAKKVHDEIFIFHAGNFFVLSTTFNTFSPAFHLVERRLMKGIVLTFCVCAMSLKAFFFFRAKSFQKERKAFKRILLRGSY